LHISNLRDLDLASGHTAYHHVALDNNFVQIRKTFCEQTVGRMDTETWFIRPTLGGVDQITSETGNQ